MRSRRRAARREVSKSRIEVVESEIVTGIKTNRNSEDQINSEQTEAEMKITGLEKRGKQTERQKRTDRGI